MALSRTQMISRKRFSIGRTYAIAGIAAVLVGLPASAQTFSGWSCSDLWYERNAVFANWGYCFQTRRGINTFGNGGCFRTSQQALNAMGSDNRRYVERIRSEERRRGC